MDHARSDDPIAAKCKGFELIAASTLPVATSSPIGNTTRLGTIEVPVSQSGSPAQNETVEQLRSGEPVRLPANKSELMTRLRAECPVLLRLLKSQPIRAVGKQRTGKSTLVKKLALLRLLLLPGHKVIAATPHYEPENPYPSVFQVVGINGSKRDYPAIARQWAGMARRIENSERNSITNIWDEFGLMDKVCDEEELTSVLTSSLREATKHGEYPVFIVHGETQAFLPGSRGLVTVLLSSTVRVETIGKLVEGADGLDEMKPTGKFRVKWLDGTKEEGQIPDWMTEAFLIQMLPNQSAPQSEKPEIANTPKPPESNVDQLNRLFNSEAVTPSHEDEEIALEKTANPISVSSELIEYVQSRTDVTVWNASSLKRANKKFWKYDDVLLNKAFQILAISERGQWDGESFRTA